MNGIPWWHFYEEPGPLDGRHLESVDPGAAQWNAIGGARAICCGCFLSEMRDRCKRIIVRRSAAKKEP
jgi:hypothetical protein